MPDNHPVSSLTEILQQRRVVVDTSSLLTAGISLLNELPDCRLVIPAIVVKELEEKRTHPTLGFLAREWLRLLERLRIKHGIDVASGVEILGYEHIILSVEPNHSTQKTLPSHLQDGSHDSTVLAVANNLNDDHKDVTLMSNDLPMRLHATLDLGLEALEFTAASLLGAQSFDGVVEVLLSEDDYLSSDGIGVRQGKPLERLVTENLPSSMPARAHVVANLEGNTKPLENYLYRNGFMDLMPRKQTAMGITARATEQDVALAYLMESPETLPITSIGGSAGTGKTLLALAAGLKGLKEEQYQRVMVFRSLHEMGQGQEMGFLPGDVGEKMTPWAGAIYDAIDVIAANGSSKGRRTGEQLKLAVKRLRDQVELSPITYLRGRSLSDSFIVLDEAQNFSRSELLNILSRAGEGTKMILCWDADQVDNRFLQAGSKADIWSVVESLKNEDLFAHVTLRRTERSRVAELSARLLFS